MEKEIKVDTVLVDYFCDKCLGKVEYKDGNMILLTDPPKFRHHCTACGDEYIFNFKYPYTKFVQTATENDSVTNKGKLIIFKEEIEGRQYITLNYSDFNPPLKYSYEINDNQITIEILERISYILNQHGAGALELKDLNL